ncbi:MAG: glucose-6-phosphate isomerase [Hungatella sp.]|nr:glucose-6-phosphate isomerase [Hungatella sp.]MCI9501208.1 glucose-6-phosphate isomerase [Hungatella sp.]
MLELTYQDRKGILSSQEITDYMAASKDILARVKKGEERYGDSLGWLDPDQWGGEAALSYLEEKAARVREIADAFVLIGVGGSNNSARAVIKALRKPGMPEIFYAGNSISPHSARCLLKELENRSVYINVIAKNFETLEPGLGFRILRRFLEEKYGCEAKKRISATGTKGSWLDKLCKDHGYDFFIFPDDIGGRFSAICDVGLFPMAVAGMDIRGLVQGAKDMRQRLMSGEEDNVAYRYAIIRNLLYKKGFRVEMLSFFEPRFRYFGKWWTQLLAESEGKDGKGAYPVTAECSEDLHSVGQFVQEGSPVIYETFLNVKERDFSYVLEADGVDDRFDYVNGRDLWDINQAAFGATCQAHGDRLPVFGLTVDRLDAYHFGQLFYFFEFGIYLSGSLLGINPFNQPGVEAYKNYMFRALGKK